ncbi:MAG TPA: hypothetical protein VMY37_03035 [Thermoguttaceae bacterium]|nr:hypothetical protein [Thermoguttaceae bacterium]
MRKILALVTVLAVVALAGTTAAFAEERIAGNSILLSSYQEAVQADNSLTLADDDACIAASDSCEMLYQYCGPRWTVGAGAVIKQRNDMPKMMLAQGAEGETMSSSDIDVDWGSGPWLELIRHMDCGWDLEVEYFSIDNYTGTAEAHDSTPVSPTWYWGQFVFDDLYARYSNDLKSLEFNLRWPLCDNGNLKGIVGVRWTELNEELFTRVTLVQGPLIARQRGMLSLNNNLYSFQLGAEGVLWEPCCQFRVEGLVKAGIGGNHMNWTLRTNGDLDTRLWDDKGKCQSAFVTEMALMAVYKPCCNVKVFAGYEAFHLKEVATVYVQTKYDSNLDHAFYHGVVLGVEFSFGNRGCGTPCESSFACE